MTQVTISDADRLVLEHSIADIQAWLQGFVDMEIERRKVLMVQEARAVLDDDPTVESMPANKDAVIALFVSREGYKSAATKEAESEAARKVALDRAMARKADADKQAGG